MADNDQAMDKRLQNALFGTPLLHPDEQNRCLGTFQERIDLRISFRQALQRDFSTEILLELQRRENLGLLIHAKLDSDILSRYVKLAQSAGIPFAIRNSQYYHHDWDNAAIILCGDCALNVANINIEERYPTPTCETKTVKPGLLRSWFRQT